MNSFDPQIETKDQSENRNTFVIIRSANRSLEKNVFEKKYELEKGKIYNLFSVNSRIKKERKEKCYLEIYEGTIAVKAAAKSPAEDLLVTSFVNK